VHNDSITRLDAFDPTASFHNSARTLMAEQMRQELIRPFGALNFVYLRAADSAV